MSPYPSQAAIPSLRLKLIRPRHLSGECCRPSTRQLLSPPARSIRRGEEPQTAAKASVRHMKRRSVGRAPRLTGKGLAGERLQERDNINFDHPESLETELMCAHLQVPHPHCHRQPCRGSLDRVSAAASGRCVLRCVRMRASEMRMRGDANKACWLPAMCACGWPGWLPALSREARQQIRAPVHCAASPAFCMPHAAAAGPASTANARHCRCSRVGSLR